jgi:hypothetical protein
MEVDCFSRLRRLRNDGWTETRSYQLNARSNMWVRVSDRRAGGVSAGGRASVLELRRTCLWFSVLRLAWVKSV